MKIRILLLLSGLVVSALAFGQTLPDHRPLRILVVSDEVNPHGLSDENLTQPGEISAALGSTVVLNISSEQESLLEIPTDQIEQATQRLATLPGQAGAYDVLIYFAHRIPNGVDAQNRQEAFVSAVAAFLAAGGGVISFHHGIYRTSGKESMQALLGAEATGNVPYDQVNGQNVIAVSSGDFITSNGIEYSGALAYEDATLGIAEADYSYFNNTPDERYPNFQLLGNLLHMQFLFASNYSDNGTTHVLGYRYQRPEWQGEVVVYQPGEYQPNALDPAGNNFQILLNAILAVAPPDEVVFADGFE